MDDAVRVTGTMLNTSILGADCTEPRVATAVNVVVCFVPVVSYG